MSRKDFEHVDNYASRPTPNGYVVSVTEDGDEMSPRINPAQSAAVHQRTETANDPTHPETIIEGGIDVGGSVINPVVGWMVGTKGECRGIDYRLHNGRNYIGRNRALDISIDDPKVSYAASVQVVYDPKGRQFMIAACGQSSNISYLNDKVLMETCDLSAHDRLQMGDCELMFVPLCGEWFSWEE